MTVTQRLARNLKHYRKLRGLTQEGLARKAGYGWSFIARLETCAHPAVPITTVERLAKALRVRVSNLLEERYERSRGDS